MADPIVAEPLIDMKDMVDLDKIRNCLHKDLAGELSSLLTEADDRAKLRTLVRFTEALVTHLCTFQNSEYIRRDKSDPSLEKLLRSLAEKKGRGGLSFGDYARALDHFPKVLRDGYMIPELALVFRESLPDVAAESIRFVEAVIDARVQFEIPVRRLQAYVDHQRSAGHGGGGKKLLPAMLWCISRVRNALHHPDPQGGSSGSERTDGETAASKAWWSEDVEFYRLLNSKLVTGVVRCLLWDPMTRLLTNYEVAEVRSSWQNDGQWYRAAIRRFQLVPPLPPPLVVAETAIEKGMRGIVRRTEALDKLHWLMRVREFPSSREERGGINNKYFCAYAESIFNDGRIDSSERERLTGMKRDFDLAENEVSSLENEVIARLLAVPTADLDGDFSLDPKVTYSQQNLVQWICTPGNKGLPPPETVRTEAARVHFWVREQCLATVRDGGVCSARAVVTAVGLPPLLIEMALGQLSKAGIIRSVGALSEKPGFSLDATYQRHDPTYKDRFNEVLEHMKRDVDGKKEIPLYLWPLIRLTNQLLVEANHPDREQDWVLLKARSQETGPGGAASVSDPDADNANGEDELKVILGETALSDRRLTDLIRTVFAAIARNQSLASIAQENMASVLPFRAGRTRYLVSLAPKHANDKEFACSIKLTLGGKTVYVESNWVRSDGVFHLQNFLDALGIGKPADSEVAKSDEPDEDTGDDDRGLIATMPTGEECPILGKTVPLFLTKLLKVLCKRQMADDPSKFLIDDVELPFAMGHVRFFMAEAPFHRDKRAFTRPVEQAGVFAEASLSWEAAIEQGRRVCKAIGVSVEPFQPHRIVLAIRLQDGALIAGDGTKEFMTELLDFLRKEGLLERAIGGTLGSNRNVMSAIPSLPSRKAVSSSVKYSYGDQTVYAPGQKGALIDYAQRVLGELGVDVIDVGEHALRWEQHVDTPSEPVAAEASPDVGV